MRKTILALIFALCFSHSYSQDYSLKTILRFNDGKVIEGLSKSNIKLEAKTLKLIIGSEKEKFDLKDVQTIEIDYGNNDKDTFERIKKARGLIGFKGKHFWVVKLVDGYMNLYVGRKDIISDGVFNTRYKSADGLFYFCQRAGEEKPVLIGMDDGNKISSSLFRTGGKKYFKDYSELASKIAKKEYKLRDIVEVVNEYNLWHEKK
jgi:hypothetical protein